MVAVVVVVAAALARLSVLHVPHRNTIQPIGPAVVVMYARIHCIERRSAKTRSNNNDAAERRMGKIPINPELYDTEIFSSSLSLCEMLFL